MKKKIEISRSIPSQVSAVQVDPTQLFKVAIWVCRQAGYPVDGDPEYESAVNLAVLKAIQTFKPPNPKPTMYAAMLALRECAKAALLISEWHKQDEAGASRERGQATPIPLDLTDFELLSFVARHGRSRAAKLLTMPPAALRDRLDEVALRIGRLLEDAP